ncbi:hypothetical protein [Sphingomonas sp. R1]|uniref:hypothetical protein n=1 Tax=Sphingomonas sp. R1 TaxID=399176 RepID=UPI0022259534|nr:hypothetical protein [Sphingomonas sp. R1]UYY76610.1 hypothetical protein OIM94_13955 [Sphingomonas sp. R1]
MRRVASASVSIAALALSACNPPTAQPLAIYRDMQHPNDWDDERVADREIAMRYPAVGKIPPFLRVGNRLYLLVQVTQPRALSTDVVFSEKISAARVAAFKVQHPELAPLLVRALSKSEHHPEIPGPTR